jgi:hypothetical protein
MPEATMPPMGDEGAQRGHENHDGHDLLRRTSVRRRCTSKLGGEARETERFSNPSDERQHSESC